MTPERQTHIRWLLILWLFVLSAVAFLDRVNLSIAGTKMEEEFSISNVQLGFVLSSFLVGYALFQTPAGWLADRFGARRILTAGVLWWGVFSVLTAAIPPGAGNAVLALLFIRFLLGYQVMTGGHTTWLMVIIVRLNSRRTNVANPTQLVTRALACRRALRTRLAANPARGAR